MAIAPNAFTNRKKLDLLATALRDNMPYVRASKQEFPQSELKGKKFGASVHTYLADPGSVQDGIVADPDTITEVELTAIMANKNTSVETDMWENFVDVEDYSKQVLKPKGLKLARTIEKDVIDQNVYASVQAVVQPKVGGASVFDTGIIGDASAALGELAVAGRLVCFQSPSLLGKISRGLQRNFLPDDIMKDLYKNRYLGECENSSVIEQPLMPKITMSANMDTAPTITFTVANTDASSNVLNYEPVSTITVSGAGKTLEEGAAYEIPGVYVVDQSGMRTNQPFVVIYHKEITGVSHGQATYGFKIPEIRLAVGDQKGAGNPNAWTPNALASLTVTLTPLLGAGKSYLVGQTRLDDALVFDSYTFDDLPSSRTENVGVDGPISLKCMEFGDGKNGVQLTRIDAPYLSKIWDPRLSVTTYVEV
jgi:hypothetical protein